MGLALVCVLLGSAAPVRAQEFKSLGDLDVEVGAEFPWPNRLGRGFEPVIVHLRSEESIARPVTVEVGRQGWDFEHRTTRLCAERSECRWCDRRSEGAEHDLDV